MFGLGTHSVRSFPAYPTHIFSIGVVQVGNPWPTGFNIWDGATSTQIGQHILIPSLGATSTLAAYQDQVACFQYGTFSTIDGTQTTGSYSFYYNGSIDTYVSTSSAGYTVNEGATSITLTNLVKSFTFCGCVQPDWFGIGTDGQHTVGDIFAYDFKTLTFGAASSTLEACESIAAAVLSTNIYTFGGINEIYSSSTVGGYRSVSVRSYDGTTASTLGNLLPYGLEQAYAGAIGSNIYLYGGYSSTFGASNKVLKYNGSSISTLGITLSSAPAQESSSNSAHYTSAWVAPTLGGATNYCSITAQKFDGTTLTSSGWSGAGCEYTHVNYV
jgi:hypothetical protein